MYQCAFSNRFLDQQTDLRTSFAKPFKAFSMLLVYVIGDTMSLNTVDSVTIERNLLFVHLIFSSFYLCWCLVSETDFMLMSFLLICPGMSALLEKSLSDFQL